MLIFTGFPFVFLFLSKSVSVHVCVFGLEMVCWKMP